MSGTFYVRKLLAFKKRIKKLKRKDFAVKMDFDETRLYYSHQQLQRKSGNPDEGDEAVENADEESVDLKAVRRHFREFLRECYIVSMLI